MKPRKRFGQNFLTNQHYVERLLGAFKAQPGESIVEIGPGRGALTFPLLKSIGTLTAIEIDRDLSAQLLRQAPTYGELRLIEADVLKINLQDLGLKPPLRIIGNLPYNISTPLLFHLLSTAAFIQDIHVMLQKEVVERLVAKPGSKTYGRLSVMIQYACLVEPLWTVPPEAFSPAPKVTSAVVKLRPYQIPLVARDPIRFATIVRTAFSHKRKTLQKSLQSLIPKETYSALGLDPLRRPETLSVEEFVCLSNH